MARLGSKSGGAADAATRNQMQPGVLHGIDMTVDSLIVEWAIPGG